MDIDAHLDLPDTIYGDCAPAHSARPSINQAYLEGLSGSAGRAEGAAHILFNPAQAPATLSKSDILVVPFTDVSWTPLLIGVGGIVAETGGQLSHTSIVAREYGLPAVVNVKRATQVIRDGQAIVVDGNDGRVYLE
jgi:pyruvate,water dikinase